MSTPPLVETPQAAPPIPRIPDAIVIAGFTLLGYLFAFVYEAGYAIVFGFPVALVSLSLTSVFVVAGTLYILLNALFFFVNFIAMVLHDVQGSIRSKLVRLTPLTIFFFAYVLLFGKRWRDWIWLLMVLLVLAAIDFLMPLLRYKGTFSERLAASEAQSSLATSFVSSYVLLEPIARRFGPLSARGESCAGHQAIAHADGFRGARGRSRRCARSARAVPQSRS